MSVWQRNYTLFDSGIFESWLKSLSSPISAPAPGPSEHNREMAKNLNRFAASGECGQIECLRSA
jgi:hypothetical protein